MSLFCLWPESRSRRLQSCEATDREQLGPPGLHLLVQAYGSWKSPPPTSQSRLLEQGFPLFDGGVGGWGGSGGIYSISLNYGQGLYLIRLHEAQAFILGRPFFLIYCVTFFTCIIYLLLL